MCDMHKLHIQANTGRPRHFTRKHPSRLQAPFKSSSLCIAIISHQVPMFGQLNFKNLVCSPQ